MGPAIPSLHISLTKTVCCQEDMMNDLLTLRLQGESANTKRKSHDTEKPGILGENVAGPSL